MTFRCVIALGAAAFAFAGCEKGKAQDGASPERASAPKGSAPSAGGDLDASTVVATWTEGGDTKSLTLGELEEARAASFLKIERERYNAIRRELEGYVLDQLMEAEAKKAGQSQDEYLDAIAAAVPEAEVKSFYENTVAKGGKGPPLEQVEGRIRQYLSMKDTVERVKKEAEMKITLPEPEVPVANFDLSGRPFKGPADARVTVVEFSDFQCPYCARATDAVDALVEAYPEDVKVVFFHFPLDFHKQAMPAAKASHCAHKQDQFWAMHDKIFENQSEMSEDDLESYAKAIDLEMEAFEACMKDPATEAFVRADMAQGMKAGVGGTPSFYVNGKQHQGPPSVDDIRPLLEG